MTTLDLLTTALRGLKTNIGRSLLTITGIVIGVGAIVLVMSLGQGAQSIILSQVEGVGGETLILRPGRAPEGPSDISNTLFADSLTRQDIEALKRAAPALGLTGVEPVVIVTGSVAYREQIYRPTILGWTGEAISTVLNITPDEGSFFTEEDIRSLAKVAVIGASVRDELFGQDNPVGQVVRIRDVSFRVVGVLPPSGQLSLFNPDELVVIPYSTAQRYLLGIDYFHEALLRAQDSSRVALVAEDVELFMRERHGIDDPDDDDFFVETQQDIVARISTVTQVLTIFLAAIAAISLVVGGVGIMNIMLVSVTERTREIGLRKALGATTSDILRQFLFEAVLLTGTGGLIGTGGAVLLALLVATAASRLLNLSWPFSFPWLAIGLGIGMATLIGLTFGLYPALKAARKSPIEALRYE